jgi:hypothetical protein
MAGKLRKAMIKIKFCLTKSSYVNFFAPASGDDELISVIALLGAKKPHTGYPLHHPRMGLPTTGEKNDKIIYSFNKHICIFTFFFA